MSFKLADRVKQLTFSSGTGGISFVGSFPGYQTFDQVLTSGDTTFYVIEENDKFEVGVGTYASNSLDRNFVLSSSNNNEKVEFQGSGVVSITFPADRAVYKNDEQYAVVSSGIIFSDETVLKPDNGSIYWNDLDLLSDANSTIAAYASGQSVQNQEDITYLSGVVFDSSQSRRTYKNIASDTILSENDDVIFANCQFSNINVYIPTAGGYGGKEILIKRTGGLNDLTIHASGLETIDGQSSFSVFSNFQSLTLISDNTNWFIS